MHAPPHTAKVLGLIIHAPPPSSSRSGVYGHKITNQIPPFSRSDAACSNATKIDPIQRWTHCHTPVEFLAVWSRAASSDPFALRAPYHTPCHVNPTLSLTRHSTHGSLNRIHDPTSFFFSSFFSFFFFFSKFKKKILNFKLKKKKKKRKLALTSKKKKKKFKFWISNFKIWKLKKNVGFTFWFYLNEPRSS